MLRISLNKLTRLISLFTIACCLPLTQVQAITFSLPSSNNALIGKINYMTTSYGDTPATIGQRYNIGVNAVVVANPGVGEQTVFLNGSSVKIATEFLLPPLPYHGVVINLPEMRMYYYPDGTNSVMTFPIGIGRIGKTIPITNTTVVRKVTNPTWVPTPDIRKFNQDQGIELPERMPAGPDNPLGPYAIYMRIPTYLIHSTIFPESIGRRASFGCIRMNEADIRQFFPVIQPGTPVIIIDMPAKVGWSGNELYLESHPPLEERSFSGADAIVEAVQQRLPETGVTMVNWQMVSYLADQPDGIPHEIGVRLN